MLELDKRVHTFTGQGSQRVGMWVDLEQHPEAQRIFHIADEVVGFPLSQICEMGPLLDLTETGNAQPAIVAHSIAALRVAQSLHPEFFSRKPYFSLGHSVGEYSALVDAGVIDIETAINLVRQRGLLMASLGGEGKMAALLGFQNKDQVMEICHETGAEGANFNGPAQIVISGGIQEIDDAIRLAGERRIKVIPLKVSRPFHSSLMRPMQEEFRKVIAPVEFKDPFHPAILNVTARTSISGEEIKENLVQQIVSPVRWDESIEEALRQGVGTYLEFGPEGVLTGLLRRIVPEARGICIKDYASAQELNL